MLGLVTFMYGLRHIKGDELSAKPRGLPFKARILLYSVLAIIGINFLLRIYALASWLLPGVGIAVLIALLAITYQQPLDYRRRMITLIVLVLSSVVYWTLFLQLFYSANLFVERLVDKNLFGLTLSTSFFWGSESIFIIVLGPLFALLWQRLAEKKKNPLAINKFASGIFCAGIGFLVLAISINYPQTNGLVFPLWVFLAYFFITVGELLLSPIGLSAITQLAPPSLVGLMMGVWFVATGFGGIFAGMIANFASVPETVKLNSEKLTIYQDAFFDYAYLAFFVAIMLFFVQQLLKRIYISD